MPIMLLLSDSRVFLPPNKQGNPQGYCLFRVIVILKVPFGVVSIIVRWE